MHSRLSLRQAQVERGSVEHLAKREQSQHLDCLAVGSALRRLRGRGLRVASSEAEVLRLILPLSMFVD